jgi:fructokinase
MSPTIAVIGEIVADAVLPPDGIVNGVAHLTVHPGGGPANTAVALARLGTITRFAGRISGGALGTLCRAKLEASRVDLSTSVVVDHPATLAIARLDTSGAASYEFYTDGTADWGWTDDSLSPVVDGLSVTA